MKKNELLTAYRAWCGKLPAKFPDPVPMADFDAFEDDSSVVNHLFFFIPDTSSGTLRCFFFFEENTFAKDAAGDLELKTTSFHLFQPK